MFLNFIQTAPTQSGVLYLLIYILITAFSLPAASILTLAGGALFGITWGSILVSFGSTIGATLAFLASRFLFQKWVQKKWSSFLKPIDQGIQKEGPWYLFALRLVPIFPFFLINLTMGLTPMRIWTFFWVSQLGMLPGTIVYVNFGTELSHINSLQDLSSPTLWISFTLLGLFPIFAKKTLKWIKENKKHDTQTSKS